MCFDDRAISGCAKSIFCVHMDTSTLWILKHQVSQIGKAEPRRLASFDTALAFMYVTVQ